MKFRVKQVIEYVLVVEADSVGDARAAFELTHDTEMETYRHPVEVRDVTEGCKHLRSVYRTQAAPGAFYSYLECKSCGKNKWMAGPENAPDGWF